MRKKPDINPQQGFKEINTLFEVSLLPYLEQQKIIKIEDKIVKIQSQELFEKLGYILFLLHIGSQINHEEKKGYFYFLTSDLNDKIFVLKNNIDTNSDFWLFYHNPSLYLQETLLFHSLMEELYKKIIQKSDAKILSKQLGDLAKLFLEDPKQFIREEFEVIDLVEFPMEILKNVLLLPKLDSNKIDPFQLFLFLYFRTITHVTLVEAYDKRIGKKENSWDVIAYDFDKSKKVFFVELTTGHPPKRLLKKIPSFLKVMSMDEVLIYITPLKKLEKGIPELLKLLQDKFPENFFLLDTSHSNDVENCYKYIIDQLNNIVN